MTLNNMKYNHAIDVAFEVISEEPNEPTLEEMLDGMQKRLKYLRENPEEAAEAFGVWDTYKVVDDEEIK